MALREDLIQSAVEFLKDPSISGSPLNKKIEFIETKGLTQEEIQEALKRSQSGAEAGAAVASVASTPTSAPTPGYDYYPNPPPIPERDWKDYFIMATTTVGVGYGLYQIVSKYVLPNILPPSKDRLEAEKEAIEQEFTRIERLLDNLETKQNEFIEANNEKSSKIDDTLTNIDSIITKANEKNLQNEESLKYLKLEVENIRSTMVSTLDSQKSVVLQELGSLEKELADLKQILMNSDISVQEGKSVELKPEEKLKKFKIPPASSVPSATDILKESKSEDLPDWQKYADRVQREEAESVGEASIPAWQRAAASDDTGVPQETNDAGIPAWQLRS